MLQVTDEQNGERKAERVDEVVEGSADADVDQVAEHGEVGGEEEDCEEEPAVVEMLVGEEGEKEKNGFFDVEEDGRSGQHSDYTDLRGRSFGDGIPGRAAEGKADPLRG